jgi:hypothetical protein
MPDGARRPRWEVIFEFGALWHSPFYKIMAQLTAVTETVIEMSIENN